MLGLWLIAGPALLAQAEVAKPAPPRQQAPTALAATPDSGETKAPELPQPEPHACATPGDDLAPAMVVIPPGRFWMGSPDSDTKKVADEIPRHGVTIPRPFALSRCEITVGQFRRFAEETPGYKTSAEKPESKGCNVWNSEKKSPEWVKSANWRNPGFAQTDEHPVVCISWDDAQAYARWLSQRTGAVYRLPTEAEWEYAARAGTETRYYWGDDKNHQQQCGYANGAEEEARAIVGANWGLADCSDSFAYTAPVASLRPNQFALYDLLGNVWEWTADCWHENYRNAPADGSAWREANGGDCGRRVVRGGSWVSGPQLLRSAYRLRNWSDVAYYFLGFRLARAL